MEIRRIDLSPEGLSRTAELLTVVFPEATHIDREYLDRLYNGNPVGPTTGIAAWEGDRLIGHYLMIPIRAVVQGEPESGIWPFQLAVDPSFQGGGVFRKLFEASREVMEEGGQTFFTGITNANSAPIYEKAFGAQSVKTLDVKIGIGALPKSLPFDRPDFARIWTPEEIAWRSGVPAAAYHAVDQGGRTAIFARSKWPGVDVQVGDFESALVPPPLKRVRRSAPFRVWIGSDPTRDWGHSRYFDLPRRLRPAPLIMTFGTFDKRSEQLDPERILWSVYDFDAF